MKVLSFNVSGQMILLENPVEIVGGSQEYLYCKFTFNSDWDGKEKLYRFYSGAEEYSAIEENGLVKVPFEVIKPPCFYLACGGYEDNEFMPTAKVKLAVRENGFGEKDKELPQGEAASKAFTAQVFDAIADSRELLEISIEKAPPIIGENGNWHIYDINTESYIDTGTSAKGDKGEMGEKGDTGVQGDKGEPGEKGEAGYTPQKGADYWTQEDKAEIVEAVKVEIDLDGKQDKLSDEQIENIDKIPDIEETANLAKEIGEAANTNASGALDLASINKDKIHDVDLRLSTVEINLPYKQNKAVIKTDEKTVYYFQFGLMYNSEIRLAETADVSEISIVFENGVYEEDYTAGLSFSSGETPTTISYAAGGILNWVGTDCTASDGLSIFQPSANTHYDIVFYFNGVQMIGLVNGFVPASGNEAV